MQTNHRISRVREWMRKHQVSSAIITNPAHQFYLSGFKALIYSRPILFIIGHEETAYILPGLEEQHAQAEAKVDKLYVYHEYPDKSGDMNDPSVLLQSHLKTNDEQGAVLAADLAYTPAKLAEELKVSGFDIIDAGSFIMNMRYKKDDRELEMIRQAGKLAETAVRESLGAVKAGVSELEIDAAGNAALFAETASNYPDATLDLTVMSPSGSVRSNMPHVFSNNRRLENGDVVIHSRQVGLNGYRAELERTFIVGDASEKQIKAFKAMAEAQEAALQAVRPGTQAKAIDLAARKVLAAHGFDKYAIHRIGHAIGISSHEEPYLRFDNTLELEEGMVFCIEPGIYIPGIGGFRHSDTVIVTADGYELITTYPGDLASLTL